ncbi:MAG TPA: hypothetical protein VGS19_05465 [Streptosporangiaceae bacterium]|nr:hypothetical protein [Streptosporangiaceae bacterium]
MLLKRAGSVLVTSAALAGVLGLSAGSATAATSTAVKATWTVKPGGAITAKAGTTTLTDKNTGNQLKCASSSGKGTLKSGSGLSGTGIGSITALTFTTCTGPLGLVFTVHNSHFPWHLNAMSFSSGVTTGTITGIHSMLSGPSCSAIVDGTSATANNGQVTATYSNSTGKLTATGGGNLHLYNVSGCFGLIKSGDVVSFKGSYAVTPKQTITSP